LDDLAESFYMSALHNGQLRTMKANYMNDDGDIRIIRPMVYVRESQTKEFSYAAKLPVINENCPACFEGPKERHRVKKLLAQEENLFPGIFGNIKSALLPLMDAQMYHDMASIKQSIAERNEKRNKGKNTGKNTGKNKGKKKVAEDSSSSSGSSSSSSSSSSSTEKCSTT
jgi:tRNA(Ile)-lysidine synthase TilS/MesJ